MSQSEVPPIARGKTAGTGLSWSNVVTGTDSSQVSSKPPSRSTTPSLAPLSARSLKESLQASEFVPAAVRATSPAPGAEPRSGTVAGDRPVVCIDVECAATGNGHNDREPISLAMVDDKLECVYTTLIRPSAPVVDFLTPLTGIEAQDLHDAPSLEEAVAVLRSKLHAYSELPLLVGAGIQNDVEWLGLKQGSDFHEVACLSEMFKYWVPSWNNYSISSLAHMADMLLPDMSIDTTHSAEHDARVSVRVFLEHGQSADAIEAAKLRLASARPKPSFAKKVNYEYHGVCMSKYHKSACICGQPLG